MKRAKILIVDDEANNRIAMKETLEVLDADIYLADSGMEALQLVANHEFAVVLLDVDMPEMDGFETAELMRQNKYTESIPIVFITAINKETTHFLKGNKAGAVDYLFKPIDPYILKSKVQIFLNLYYQKTQTVNEVLQELEVVKKALEKSSLELQEIALHHPLTELPNRKQFEEEVGRYLFETSRSQTILAVLLIDLDNFKLINDTLGYNVGDDLLKIVAKKILAEITKKAFMAHLGEDSFAIVLNNIHHPNDAGDVANALRMLFQESIEISGNKINITLSTGIACYPSAGKTANDLIKNAEIAMYRTKSLGKNNWHFFNDELQEKYKNRLIIEKALRQALDKNEFYLVYQVIYQLKTNVPSGIEALLRWKHPTLGDISPVDFIPIAENIGLIHQIGIWVIEQACRQFSEWSKAGFEHFCYSINLSPDQLQQGDLVGATKEALSHLHLGSGNLELELSETTIMQHANGADPLLKDLHQMGFKIALENFGTSYSSLAILKQLAIDTIKIDRSFVREMMEDHNVAVIVKTIIALAKGLGLRVVAEGIETKEQLEFFIREGCEEGQGFYLSKPLSAELTTRLLSGELVK